MITWPEGRRELSNFTTSTSWRVIVFQSCDQRSWKVSIKRLRILEFVVPQVLWPRRGCTMVRYVRPPSRKCFLCLQYLSVASLTRSCTNAAWAGSLIIDYSSFPGLKNRPYFSRTVVKHSKGWPPFSRFIILWKKPVPNQKRAPISWNARPWCTWKRESITSDCNSGKSYGRNKVINRVWLNTLPTKISIKS